MENQAFTLDEIDNLPENPKPNGFTLEELDSMQPQEVNREEFDLSSLLEVPQSLVNQWESMGEIGPIEAASRKDLKEAVPFFGSAVSAGGLWGVKTSIDRIKSNNYKDNFEQRNQDLQRVQKYMFAMAERQIRGVSGLGQVAEGVTELPAFAGEFLLTGGVYSVGKLAARKAVEETVEKVLKKSLAKVVTKKVIGAVAGTAARTATGGSVRIAEGTLERQVNARLEPTKDGIKLANEVGETPFTSFMKSTGNVFIENLSEVSGASIGKAGGAIFKSVVPKRMSDGVIRLYQKLHPNDDIGKLLTKSGYNGFLQELGEERLGDFLRAVSGVEDFGAKNPNSVFDRITASVPNAEQMLVEAGVLAVPMAGASAVRSVFKTKSSDKLADTPIEESVLDKIIAKTPENYKNLEQTQDIKSEQVNINKENVDIESETSKMATKMNVLEFAKRRYEIELEESKKSGNIEKSNKISEKIKFFEEKINNITPKEIKDIPDLKGLIEAKKYGESIKGDTSKISALKKKVNLIEAQKNQIKKIDENYVRTHEQDDFLGELVYGKINFYKEALKYAEGLDKVNELPNFNSKEFSTEKAKEFGKNATVKQIELMKQRDLELEKRANEIRTKGENTTEAEDLEGLAIGYERSKIHEALKETKRSISQMKVGESKTSKEKAQIRQSTGQVKDQGKQISERKAFIQSLKDQVKAASGASKATREEIFDIQNATVDLINNSELEANDKAKFLKLVKNIQTQEQFQKALPQISKRIIDLENKEEKRSLISEIKKTVSIAKEGSTIAIDFVNAMEDLVSEVDLQNRKPETIERLNRSAEFFKAQIEQGKDVEIPKQLLKKLNLLNKTPLESLSNEELNSLLSQIKLLEEQGQTKLRTRESVITAQKERDLEQIKADSVPIESKEQKKAEIGERLSAVDNFNNKVTQGLNIVQEKNLSISPMDVVFDLLDGVKNYKGANYKIFKAKADVAWSEFLTKRDNLVKPVIDLANSLKMNEGNFERIGVHAAREQEGGIQKLIDTGLTQKQIDNVVLTEQEIKVYNEMRKKLDNLRPEIEEVMRVVYNQPLAQVKNYFSFMTDFEAMSDAEIRERFGDNVQEFGEGLRKNVGKGMTIKRTLGKQKIKLNAMEVFLKHTDNAAYLVHMGPVTKYLGELAATEEYGEAVGEFGQEIVREWIDLLARKGRATGDRIIWMDTLRKNVGLATLGFKLSSTLIQPTAFFQGAALIGNYAFEGGYNIAASKEWRQFVMNNFPEVKARIGDDPAFMEFGGNTNIDKVGKASFWALQKLDAITASSIAVGAYIKNVKEKGGIIDLNNPDKEAIQEAQIIVRRTQSSSFFKDAPSAISRGGLTGNVSIDKTILQFQSFMINEWSLVQHDLFRAGIKGGNYQQGLNIATWLIIADLAEISVRRLSKELISFITGDDLDDWAETFKDELSLNLINKVPFVSQIISSIAYSSNPIPMVEMADKIIEKFSAAMRAKSPSAKQRNFIRGMILAAGAFGGIPGMVQAEQITKSFLLNDKKLIKK